MAPPSSSLGIGSTGRSAEVDAIDLTLSSPEPEQRMRLPSQQQRLPIYFKNEGRSSSGDSRRIKSERGSSSTVPRGQARVIDPQHLSRIVRSTDHRVIQAVLLELCSQSSALSGAVARALAPHSTFARTLIRRHQPNVQESTRSSARPPVRDELNDGQDARERMRRRLAARNAALESSRNQIRSTSTITGAQSARSAGSQSAPRIKNERQPDIEESDSDLDQYIPRDFPVRSQQASSSTRLPLRDVSSSHTARTLVPFSSSQTYMHGQGTRKQEPRAKPCINCHEEIEEEDIDGLCFYHVGPFRLFNGKSLCGQCNKGKEQPGCGFGQHVTKSATEGDALKRHPPNRSQSPSKRPRMG
ncbi:hypothetical protein HBI24_190110 [Parastagonospora nodorum]|nr:hypothetical protein HBH53_050690 [Parastagonospora nodorum]KAH4107480.1 hypothetical protein HBH46_062330 [Parastagonospora nodorum]KAH4125257.1 hypothetical protein HBH47_060860 [Parastagonospora nodorum]KAH4302499.1 hypothetical protein HBI02_141080 [Parastagonospora nodorum]KAH4305312.1 hypothetical protein HBI01_067450 [Parastagonospora nodorum]